MVPLDRELVSSYRLSIVTMSLSAAVWPQFATQLFRGGIGRLTCIGSYVDKQVTTFTFRAQATTCSKHHTRTVMDAGCECAPWARSANLSDSWALVLTLLVVRHNYYPTYNNCFTIQDILTCFFFRQCLSCISQVMNFFMVYVIYYVLYASFHFDKLAANKRTWYDDDDDDHDDLISYRGSI